MTRNASHNTRFYVHDPNNSYIVLQAVDRDYGSIFRYSCPPTHLVCTTPKLEMIKWLEIPPVDVLGSGFHQIQVYNPRERYESAVCINALYMQISSCEVYMDIKFLKKVYA